MNKELTHLQLQTVYSQVDDIISTLDEGAISELFGGNLDDVDYVLESLYEETANVIAFDGGKIKSGSFGYLDRFSTQVDESFKCYSLNYFIVTMLPEFIMNWHHIEWGNLVQIYRKLSIIASRDHGKCLGKNTPILMYNGSIKFVQDIMVGDLVMGMDYKPRRVLSIHNGVDNLYKVHQSNADDYVVNSRHILTVIDGNDIKDIEIKNVLSEIFCKYKGFKISKYNLIRTSSLSFSSIGEGEYFGFTCDGDQRFLLGDGTVTHNSFFFSFAYIIWKMYRYQRSNSYRIVPKEYRLSKYGMLITNEFGLAKHLLSLIKEEIEGNDLLREKLYPGKERKWAETEITCKNGASFVVKSFGSKMRGFHPGYLVTDDFMNDSVLYSEDQRNKYISIFHSVLMNALLSGGQAINVGTPYSTKDLFADLKTKSSWFSFEYPAIFPDGSLLWEGRHNIKSILDKKETQGSLIFSREILCRPISSESTIFPWSILQRSFLGMDDFTLVNNIWSHPNKFQRVAIGCDFSISANVGADYSVFIVLGVDEFGRYWLLHMYREKGKKYTEQIAVLKKLNTDFKPDVIFVESNQMQVIFAQGATDAGLPVVEHNTGVNKHDLRGGLPGLAILFENNKFRFPRGDQKSIDITDTICLELSSVTWTEKGRLEGVGEHDDTCMALWIARLAADYINQGFNFAFL